MLYNYTILHMIRSIIFGFSVVCVYVYVYVRVCVCVHVHTREDTRACLDHTGFCLLPISIYPHFGAMFNYVPCQLL